MRSGYSHCIITTFAESEDQIQDYEVSQAQKDPLLLGVKVASVEDLSTHICPE